MILNNFQIQGYLKKLRFIIVMILLLFSLLSVLNWLFPIFIANLGIPSLFLLRLCAAIGFILVGLQLILLDSITLLERKPVIRSILFAPMWLLSCISFLYFILSQYKGLSFSTVEKMRPMTSVCFFLISLGGILYPKKCNLLYLSQYSILTVLLISILSWIGYLFDVFQIMPISTTSLFLLSAIGFLTLSFGSGVTSIFRGPTATVKEKIKIVFFCVLIPIGCGWLQYKGESLGLYERSLGFILSTILGIIILTTLIYRSLRKLYFFSLEVEKDRDEIYSHSLSLEEHVRRRTAELTQSLERLVVSEKNFMALTEAIRKAIVSFDEKGIINFWNLTAKTIFDFEDKEIIGTSAERILNLKLILEATSNQAIDDFESVGINKEGKEIPIEIRASKWSMEGMPCIVLLIQDLTEQKRLEKKIENQKNILINSMKMKSLGEMAGGIAHEINTPLATICLRISEIKQNLLEEDYYTVFEDVCKIEETVFRINKIIKGLKRFAGDGEKESLSFTPTKSLIDDLLSLCNERLKSKGIKIIIGEKINNSTLFCLPIQTVQCLINLLNNACDALESQTSENKWIEVDFNMGHEFSEISVTDSGTGIPEEFRMKIMQPFFTSKAVGHGVGLGLNITKSLMERQGGYIRLDSSHKNTRFILGFKNISESSIAK